MWTRKSDEAKLISTISQRWAMNLDDFREHIRLICSSTPYNHDNTFCCTHVNTQPPRYPRNERSEIREQDWNSLRLRKQFTSLWITRIVSKNAVSDPMERNSQPIKGQRCVSEFHLPSFPQWICIIEFYSLTLPPRQAIPGINFAFTSSLLFPSGFYNFMSFKGSG